MPDFDPDSAKEEKVPDEYSKLLGSAAKRVLEDEGVRRVMGELKKAQAEFTRERDNFNTSRREILAENSRMKEMIAKLASRPAPDSSAAILTGMRELISQMPRGGTDPELLETFRRVVTERPQASAAPAPTPRRRPSYDVSFEYDRAGNPIKGRLTPVEPDEQT